MKTIYSIFALCFFCLSFVVGQNTGSLLYTNVTIHVGNGKVIENGMLGIRDGKIDLVDVTKADAASKYDKTIDGKITFCFHFF